MASTKAWSYGTGERNRNRVRAFEKSPGGVILVEYYEGGPVRERRRVSLGHRDRTRAK